MQCGAMFEEGDYMGDGLHASFNLGPRIPGKTDSRVQRNASLKFAERVGEEGDFEGYEDFPDDYEPAPRVKKWVVCDWCDGHGTFQQESKGELYPANCGACKGKRVRPACATDGCKNISLTLSHPKLYGDYESDEGVASFDNCKEHLSPEDKEFVEAIDEAERYEAERAAIYRAESGDYGY